MRNTLLLLAISFNVFLNAQNYIPDASFGETGSVVTNYNMYYDNDQAPKNVFFENNKYIFTQKTQFSCFNYDGTVDYSFGTLGYAKLVIPNCPFYTITIKSSKIINNDIFAFGKAYDPDTGIFYGFIAKMSIDGTFDTTFGNNGIVALTIGGLNNDNYSDGITDIGFKNGNYYGIGTVAYQDSNSVFRKNIFVVKLNANGIINLTNDPSGIKKIASIDGHAASSIYEHQGELLIIGHITANNTTNENSLTLLKINENGDLISTFGIDGVKKITLSQNGWRTGESFRDCKLIGDDIYVLRTYFVYSYVLQKIQKINISDLTTTDISATENNTIVNYLIDNDKILILGCLSNCQNDFNIIRRNIDGTLDNTFNQTGTYSYSFPQPNNWTITYDSATVMVKDTNNRILIGGYTSAQFYTAAPYHGFAMLRIKDEELSTTNIEFDHLILSPNPVQNILNIENQNHVPIDNIEIFDATGKIVFSSNNPPNRINLETLKEGLYFVKISSGKKDNCFKIIKNK